VRPLLGGFFAWRDEGLPLEDFPFDAPQLTKITAASSQ
jgi:3-mercaptopyruvate sulfurtransferase SseA